MFPLDVLLSGAPGNRACVWMFVSNTPTQHHTCLLIHKSPTAALVKWSTYMSCVHDQLFLQDCCPGGFGMLANASSQISCWCGVQTVCHCTITCGSSSWRRGCRISQTTKLNVHNMATLLWMLNPHKSSHLSRNPAVLERKHKKTSSHLQPESLWNVYFQLKGTWKVLPCLL